jgi:tRNA pseudouridine38-40 synthase
MQKDSGLSRIRPAEGSERSQPAGERVLSPAELRDIGPAAEHGGGRHPYEELVRLRLDVAYDGTDFAGWAVQRGQRTVQGELEKALATVLRLAEAPASTCAGRTDAGVHARGQVCHVDVPRTAYSAVPGRNSTHPPAVSLLRRLAGALPEDVRVRAVREAPPGFDARFSAVWRRYAYRVCDDLAAADPLRRREVLFHARPLDVASMNAASQRLLGEHDFAAFCRRREGATTVRRLLELWWERDARGLVVARVVADAFCHSMVRSLVGALLAVGVGQRSVEWPAAVLAGRVRDSAVNVVPPRVLTLEEVGYPPDDDLASRAQAARRRRTATAGGGGSATAGSGGSAGAAGNSESVGAGDNGESVGAGDNGESAGAGGNG